MESKSIKVIITDDHPLAIEGLRNMLRNDDNIEVIAAFSSAKALLDGLKIYQPDILLLDILLPDAEGPVLAGNIIKAFPNIRIVALTSLDTPAHVRAMIKQGCKGYILKNTDKESLVYAIQQVYNGVEYIEPALKEKMLHNVLHYRKISSGKSAHLTQREKEILRLIANEMTSQQIADQLFLSLRTVETHRFNLQKKLNVHNNIALIKIAIQMGLLE